MGTVTKVKSQRPKIKNIVIVGAGVSGLTAGYKLAEAGYNIEILEKEKEVGGLARSFYYDGFTFDIGPHRFHTDYKNVEKFILEILAKDYIVISRQSGVFMFGKYFNWPLERQMLFKIPPLIALKIARDLFFRTKRVEKSFEDFILNKYGKTIYKFFFKPYTQKFLFLDGSDIHRDWGEVGVNRAVIDKKVRANTTFDLVKNMFLPTPVKTNFIYPKDGGIAQFSVKLKNKIKKLGGKIKTCSKIEKIETGNGKITNLTFGKSILKPDVIVWTAPLNILCKLLNSDSSFDLSYLSVLCFNVMVKKPPRIFYQWCYYGGGDTIFCRISTLTLFNLENAPNGQNGLCVEITALEGDENWQNPQQLIPQLKKDLIKVGLIDNEEDILDIKIEKISNVYPTYKLNYPQELKKTNQELDKYSNLVTLGRTGSFWYNNMDHSIKQALEFVDYFIKNPDNPKFKFKNRTL